MDKLSDSLIGKIQGKTGIIITEALQPAIHEFINRRMKELNLSAESYSTRLEDDDTEMELLVNASTVNETYFFRDEAHYEFLQNNFFSIKKHVYRSHMVRSVFNRRRTAFHPRPCKADGNRNRDYRN